MGRGSRYARSKACSASPCRPTESPRGAPPALGTQLDHCAFCVPGGVFDLLTAGRSKLPAAADEDTRYARPQPVLHKLAALRGAQPRGPPIHS